jgi:protoheme IX farnesyltransferase
VGAWDDPAVLVLAALVFLWTPTHFWALAILYREDYRRAGVPMLPVQAGMRESALWVLLHTGGTVLAAVLLGVTPALGVLYLLPVGLVTADLLKRNLKLVADPSPLNARSLFMASNVYLMVVLLAICVDTVFGKN